MSRVSRTLASILSASLLASFAVALVGCTPSAERLCGRKMRLSEDRFGKLDPASRKKGFAHCIELANQEKRDNPKRYRCRASCVLDARHLDDAMECDKGCS